MNILILFLSIVAISLFVFNIWLLWWASHSLLPFFMGGGPYVPIPKHHIATVIKLADIKPNDVVIDLGSGDGRLLIAAMRAGAREAIGYEIHPGLVRLSRRLVRNAHLEHHIHIHQKSFWHADVSKATVVIIYQISYAMKRIEHKLLTELPIGASVVAHGFKFPNWKPERTMENTRLYVKNQNPNLH